MEDPKTMYLPPIVGEGINILNVSPNPTQHNPAHGWTQSTSISDLYCTTSC